MADPPVATNSNHVANSGAGQDSLPSVAVDLPGAGAKDQGAASVGDELSGNSR